MFSWINKKKYQYLLAEKSASSCAKEQLSIAHNSYFSLTTPTVFSQTRNLQNAVPHLLVIVSITNGFIINDTKKFESVFGRKFTPGLMTVGHIFK